MVEKITMSSQTVVDLASYRRRVGARAPAISVRTCRHCGAVLGDGEREEECSSTLNVESA